MTPAEIDAMPAGAEMDALIASEVLGWDHLDIERVNRTSTGVDKFSTDGTAMLQFINTFGVSWKLQNMYEGRRMARATVCIPVPSGHSTLQEFVGTARKTEMPLAVCRAALKAAMARREAAQVTK